MQKIYQHFLVAAGLVGAMLAFPGCKKDSTSKSSTGSIIGKVTPANAVTTVTARDSTNTTQTFDVEPNLASGDFTIFDLKPGTYQVNFVTKAGFTPPARRTARVVAGESVDLGTIVMTSSVVGKIRGFVKPKQGVITRVMIASTLKTDSKAPSTTSGEFLFEQLPPGSYTVSFTTPFNYLPPSPLTVSVLAGQEAFLDTISAVLNRGSIRGYVKPQGAITGVSARSTTGATTNAVLVPVSGEYNIQNLTPGSYTLTFNTAPEWVKPAPRVVTVVAEQETFADTVRTIRNKGTLTGRVVPGSGIATVVATDSANVETRMTVDATGRFTFDIRPSTYRISFLPAAGYIPPPPVTARVRAGRSVDVGSISVLPAGNPSATGTFTYKVSVNGSLTLRTATAITATRAGNYLIITGRSGNETVSFALSGVTGPGGFMLYGANSTSYGSYQKGGSLWATATSPNGRGSVTVSAFSTSPRKISGTFSFTPAIPVTAGAAQTGNQIISNGVFTDISF